VFGDVHGDAAYSVIGQPLITLSVPLTTAGP
jgi:hypothetical protein